MADKTFKYVRFVTEVMTARHTHLSEPDTEGEYADGKYKTEATAGADYTQRFKAEIQAVSTASFNVRKAGRVSFICDNRSMTAGRSCSGNSASGAAGWQYRAPRKNPCSSGPRLPVERRLPESNVAVEHSLR